MNHSFGDFMKTLSTPKESKKEIEIQKFYKMNDKKKINRKISQYHELKDIKWSNI